VDKFEQTGILKLHGAFSRQDADRMVDSIWRFLETHTDERRDNPSTWQGRPGVLGGFKRLKRSSVFAPFLGSAAVRDALDGVFGAGGWKRPSPAVQILMTYPNAPEWTMPAGLWHTDAGFGGPTWPTFAVKLFALLADHDPGGGATLAIAGSHRLVEQYTPTLQPSQHGAGKDRWGKFVRHYGLVDGLHAPGDGRVIDGVPVELVEMTGKAGDVYVMHLHVFHCVAPNASASPRLMLGKAVVSASAHNDVLVDDEERRAG
jgi:hypothetical protein